MIDLVIKNSRVIDPANARDGQFDIEISAGIIHNVVEHSSSDAKQVIDGTGLISMPGIIDSCVRLRELDDMKKASLISETQAAVAGGITTLICPPDSRPVIDTPAMVQMISEGANTTGRSRVRAIAAITRELKGELLTDMALLQEAGCVAVSNGPVAYPDTLTLRRALQYASTYDILVVLSPLDWALMGNGCVHEGEVSTRLGLPAIPEAAETVGVARDIAVIETTGAKAHFDLISCARSLAMIKQAKQRQLPITTGVAIHQLLLDESAVASFDPTYKVLPPLRQAHDRKALCQGIAAGDIDVICSDHQPHGADAKLAPFSEAAAGISGLETLLPLTMSLVENDIISLNQAIAALTCNPARIFGLDAGTISKGSAADICLFNPEQRWTFDIADSHSRGCNSPFAGNQMPCKVLGTWVAGKQVYADSSLTSQSGN